MEHRVTQARQPWPVAVGRFVSLCEFLGGEEVAGSWAYWAHDSRDQNNSGSFRFLFCLTFHLGRVDLPWPGERPEGESWVEWEVREREKENRTGRKEVILQSGFSFKPVPFLCSGHRLLCNTFLLYSVFLVTPFLGNFLG